MTRKSRFGVVLVAFSLFLLLQAGAICALEVPSPELLSAALNDQIKAGCIDVNYDFEGNGKAAGIIIPSRYVRTPGIQYFSEKQDDVIAFSWFDRVNQALRQFGSDRDNKRGLVDTTKSNTPLSQATLPDPILYNLPAGTLQDVISKGTVSNVMESIEGHDCWRIDITISEKPYAGDRYSIWVDPEITFCPRRIEAHWPNDTSCISASFSDYSNLNGKVWFPMNIKWTIRDFTNKEYVSTAKVLSAKMISEADVQMIDTKFPSGTNVEDRNIVADYIVP